MAQIDLIEVCKTLHDRAKAATFAVRDVTLSIPHGKTMVVLGPSGCGKTTLLKIIAGLLAPDRGEVRSGGIDITAIPPGQRRIGMVFQNYALYPHFTAKRNVLAYFLFRKKTPELDALAKAKYQRTSELMGVDLEYLLDRKPTTLSGGEQQRVALGRCITRDAALFLVDEPFANLDQALREKYRVNLKMLLRQFNITTVYVTHDHNEALILADLLAVMNRGRIEQVGTFQEVYDLPRNVFVAGFVNVHADTPPLSLVDARRFPGHDLPDDVRLGVRPEDVDVSREPCDGGVRGIVAQELTLPMKNVTTLQIQLGDDELHARLPGTERYGRGDAVWVAFRRYHAFDRQSGERLGTYPV